eukprot:TRINITY_DN3758_c0_g1_i1.p1 TRINITY_DN3758_c0_g1~~TRINITY_DN3758_c0_g1_i1.p1  ORF type:complete len:104 (+),score=6.23 TRINITY_DN3758_c0_g1_i1:593-904(+)
MNNPKFKLTVQKDSFMKLILDAPDTVGTAIGFYVFLVKDGKIGKPSEVSQFTQTAKAKRVVTSKDVTLPAGEYVVMPTTFVPKKQANFILSVYSENSFLLSPM